MGTLTISDWTGKLYGTAGADYSLLSSGGFFTGPNARHAVDANTVALWRFDGSWSDAGSGGYTLTPYGNVALATDQWMGGAASFPATTVSYGSLSLYKTTMTLEGWIKASSWPDPVANLVRKQWAFQVFAYRTNLLCAYFWDDTQYYRRWWVLPSSLVGGWHHWAVCWDGVGRSQRAWVDGVELTVQGYNNTTTATGSDAYPVYVGECPGVYDDVRLSNVVRYSANFTPHRYETSDVYTAAGVVDAGSVVRWDSLAITCATRTSNEVYAVYLQPSASATPDTGGAWTQAATGQTGSATLDLSGLGLASARYLHTRIAHTPSTDALQTYNIAVDSMAWTYSQLAAGHRSGRPSRLGPVLLPLPGVML